MRVGMVVYGLDRPLGGIARCTLELARALNGHAGAELVLLTAGSAPGAGLPGAVPNIALWGCARAPGLVSLGNAWIPLWARRLALDVVHDPSGLGPFFWGASGARTVVTLHDVFAWSVPGHSTHLDTWLYRRWLPRVLPRVDAVIADSHVSQGDIVRYLGVDAEKVTVIYPGISDAYQPVGAAKAAAVVARYGLVPGYLLYLGSIETRKNVGGLLQAYARLRQMGEQRPLVVAGTKRGRAAPVEQTVQQLRLQPHVRFTGYVADEDLPALYSGAELFVFPSLYEGFGLPPLEAMACGTPVVCSNAGSLPEVVGDAALTVDPQGVEGLALAMRRVLQDMELAHDLRRRGLERARLFSWEKAARETWQLYHEVCTRPGRRQG